MVLPGPSYQPSNLQNKLGSLSSQYVTVFLLLLLLLLFLWLSSCQCIVVAKYM